MRQALGASLLCAMVAALPVTASAVLPAADTQGAPLPTLAPMLDRVTPAVVNIATRSKVHVRDNPLLMDPFFRRFFGIPDQPRERTTQSLGSGVVVDAKQGYVLTNNHVIDQAAEITVTLRDGRSFNATVIGTDRDTDVAVIQIPADNLTAVPTADSQKLRVGDFVVAIGNPFGLGQTVTSGIVSALGRSGLGIEGYEDFIQTDASINPGNSGGALVNLAGELVGVNTAIYAPNGGNVGIGFAIPINMAVDIMQQLVAHGEVRRGKLGITAQDLNADLAKAFGLQTNAGAVLARVIDGSLADKAGLKVGDVITALGGRPIANAAELRTSIGLMRVNEPIEVVFYREGQKQQVSVVLQQPKRTSQKGEVIDPRFGGATLTESADPADLEGVALSGVDPRDQAAQLGLQDGDVILSVNRKPVSNLKELKAATKNTPRLLLQVRRGDQVFFIMIQ